MTIEQLHDILYELLCQIDDACRKENVKYFLSCGTQLGAVREGDFIPWDDDLDLEVMAEDYADFKHALEKHLPSYIKVVEPNMLSPQFRLFIVRVIDTRYVISAPKFPGDSVITRYAKADVFISSRAPHSLFTRKMLFLHYRILYGLGMGHRVNLDIHKFHGMRKAQVMVLSFLGRFIPMRFIYKIHWKTQFWNQKQEHPYVYYGSFHWCFPFFPSNCYEVSFRPIRDRQFPVPKGFDTILTGIYDNYMVPERDSAKYAQHLIPQTDSEDQLD